jgi:putative lipoic acid-binding regulatory protein
MSGLPPIELLDSVHEFPGEYTVKAFGPHNQLFVDGVTTAAALHHAKSGVPEISARASSKGTYICVTAVVWVSTADEVHRLYEAVQQVPGLKRVL